MTRGKENAPGTPIDTAVTEFMAAQRDDIDIERITAAMDDAVLVLQRKLETALQTANGCGLIVVLAPPDNSRWWARAWTREAS